MKNIYQDLLFEKDKLFLEGYSEELRYREDIVVSSSVELAMSLSVQSKIYDTLLDFLRDKEIIYFVPWINLGGADKVIVEYTKFIETQYKAGLVTSINSGSRIDRITIPCYDLVSDGKGWEHLSLEDKLHIITKAVINSHVKVVHIVNSDIALQTLKYYANVYKEHQVKTIATFFCPDYDWVNKQYHGYPVMYPEIFESADIVLSDNNYWYTYFKTLNSGIPFEYSKLAVPVEEIEQSYGMPEGETKKILWASRICNQKLFDVLKEIIIGMQDYTFVIYGGEPEEERNHEIFKEVVKMKNVDYRGSYKDISEINFNEFDLFLYTSLFDGIPNIILETVASSIPIVTANVGGISEVFGEDYSLLVKEVQNPQAYIEKINEFYDNILLSL